MKIEEAENGFIEYCDNDYIEKIICKYDNTCTICYHDKTIKCLDVNCSSYNLQYGIPVSKDGKYLFVSNWEKGLFAYNISIGEKAWEYNSKKIRNILVYSDYLVVSTANKDISKIDILTGKCLKKIKSGAIHQIFDLEYSYIFVDSIAGKCCIINTEEMTIIKKYSSSIINPYKCLSVMITDVLIHDNALVIVGTEEYPQKTFSVKKAIEGKTFFRKIDLEINTVLTQK